MPQLARYLGVDWRELWDARDINGSLWLPRASGGHKITLNNGAARKTTADGIKFDSSGANSILDIGALHNASAKLWISGWFKLPIAPTGSNCILTKRVDDNNKFELYFSSATNLRCWHRDAAATVSDITLNQAWSLDTWHHFIMSLSNTGGHRFLIDGALVNSNADATAAPNGGNILFGAEVAGVWMFSGDVRGIVIGTDDLTTTEETDLYKGIPPADAVNLYLCDEGEGTTLNDLGSGGNNGTLGSAVRWQFGGTKKSCLGLDGINSYGASDVGVDWNGNHSYVWVGRIEHDMSLSRVDNMLYINVNGSNHKRLLIDTGTALLQWYNIGGGAGNTSSYATALRRGNYAILVIPHDGTNMYFYENGVLKTTTAYTQPTGSPTLYVGTTNAVALPSPSKPMLLGIVDGALTGQQVLQLSRRINSEYGLGLSI